VLGAEPVSARAIDFSLQSGVKASAFPEPVPEWRNLFMGSRFLPLVVVAFLSIKTFQFVSIPGSLSEIYKILGKKHAVTGFSWGYFA
jgi:hypothetical protein